MLFVFAIITLSLMSLPLLNGRYPNRGRIEISGFDGVGILIAFATTCFVASRTSPLLSVSFGAAALIYEIAAAVVWQFLGHSLTRVRLIPLPRLADPRSERDLTEPLEACFAALSPSAIALIPMVTGFALSCSLFASAPEIADALRTLALAVATFNFLSLLPLPLLNGGKVTLALFGSDRPVVRYALPAGLALALLIWAAQIYSYFLAAAAVFAALNLYPSPLANSPLTTAPSHHRLLILATYLVLLLTHFTAGRALLIMLI